MSTRQLLDEMEKGFARRKYSAGLLVAMIDFVRELGVPNDSAVGSYEDLIENYDKQEYTRTGGRANTLIVEHGDDTISLRPFYNKVQRFFRVEHERLDYPSSPGHATQAWSQYLHWLDVLCKLSESELVEVRNQAVAFVLDELPSHAFDPASLEIESPTFKYVLEEFDFSNPRGEPSGAAFQGAVFGFSARTTHISKSRRERPAAALGERGGLETSTVGRAKGWRLRWKQRIFASRTSTWTISATSLLPCYVGKPRGSW